MAKKPARKPMIHKGTRPVTKYQIRRPDGTTYVTEEIDSYYRVFGMTKSQLEAAGWTITILNGEEEEVP